jgi:L-seryl-tRNA(Ser) seleniumtransferase
MPNVFRNLPSVGELLESPPLKSLIERVNRNVVVSRVRHFLDDMQSQLRTAAGTYVPAPAELALRIAEWIGADRKPTIVPVINATGMILHSKLGGVPLAEEAIAELAALTQGYASLEIDLATGSESAAAAAVERLLIQITGCEAATIASSQAGAALVTLAALAAGREVVVARGQVTTVDDGYRLPELFRAGQAILREAGTAKIAGVSDYTTEITPQTAAIWHGSGNGALVTEKSPSASLAEISSLARSKGLVTIDSLEIASLIDLTPYGVSGVPLVSESRSAGADVTIFRGDDYVGGPPCGIILGRRSVVEKIVSHPLMRAVRSDKLALYALAATLRLYEDGQMAERAIPVLSLLATPLENLRQRAERLAPQLAATDVARVEIEVGQSLVNGGETAGQVLPTIVLALTPREGTAEQLAAALRLGMPAVVGRIHLGRLVLDLRSVRPRDDIPLVNAIEALQRREESMSVATNE